MSLYKTVYCPEGGMYEVPQHVFEDVVLNHGWTQTKPVVREPAPTPIAKEEKVAPKAKTSFKKEVKPAKDAPETANAD